MQFEEQDFLVTKLYNSTARGAKKLKRQRNASDLEVIKENIAKSDIDNTSQKQKNSQPP